MGNAGVKHYSPHTPVIADGQRVINDCVFDHALPQHVQWHTVLLLIYKSQHHMTHINQCSF